VLALRDETHWGAHKIAYVLKRDGQGQAPHRSTVNRILKRNGRITVEASEAATPFIRFEHPEPNDLLQMDFMGPFSTAQGACHSLTVLDDHSRFSLCLAACANQQSQTVMAHLRAMFERYGLPYRMTMDNGSPWADTGRTELTRLAVWIIRLGVRISHSRPYHPQTQGKDERFHQTVQRELTNHRYFRTVPEVQRAFDRFRDRYNLIRPHESLGMAVPASRYRISHRPMPLDLPAIEYPPGDVVRKVTASATIQFRGRLIRVGKACIGLTVGIRPTTTDGLFEVFLCGHKVRDIDLRHPSARKKVSTMS
jgi:transposase InsO family protein